MRCGKESFTDRPPREIPAVVMDTVWIYSIAFVPQEFSMPHFYRQGYKPSRLQMPKWLRKAWAWL